jgi:hypothetical protein
MASSPLFRPAIAALTAPGERKNPSMKSLIQLTKRVSPALSLITSDYPAAPKPSEGGPLPRRSFSEGGSLIAVLLLALVCFGLSPAPKAFGVSPAPDGAYPGANTAEGQSALQSLTSGIHDTALGYQTLFGNTAGHDNVASGFQALFSNTTGNYDTANGGQALYKNTTGSYNTATGFRALYSNTTGIDNTANGYEALTFNTIGHENLADGFKALYNNITGAFNTANGSQALYKNTGGGDNTANGWHALFNNTAGDENTASGSLALSSNTTGGGNTANGYEALANNTMGINNTANGHEALFANTTGGGNTANGVDALTNNTTGIFNTANGLGALESNTTGDRNIALGEFSGLNLTTGSYNIDIGNQGVANDANTIRIGDSANQLATFVAGIYGATASGGVAVYVNSEGQLGTMTSSQKYKQDIHPMDKASEAILELKPVTFRYKRELDPKSIPQFGLVAEEVEKVDPNLVARDAQGKAYTVRYEAVNAMLLNEFLKAHRKVEEQEATIAQLRKDFQATVAQHEKKLEAVTARLEEQASQIQKVSAQLEVSSPRRASQAVANNQ